MFDHTRSINPRKIDKIHRKTLEHSPYSPDLSPRDYHMFGPLEEELGNHHFDDDDDAIGYSGDQIHSLTMELKNFRFVGKNVWKQEII